MEPTPELLLGSIAGTLDAAQASALARLVSQDPELALRLTRLRVAVEATRDDAREAPPSAVIAAAKELGRRLESRRAPSLLEQFTRVLDAVIARPVFDSRLEGALAGLRGGSGFALAFAAEGAEIEIECGAIDGDRFGIMGQATGCAFTRVECFTERDGAVVAVTDVAIDADGMFRLELPTDRYTFRFHRLGQDRPIDVIGVDVP